MKILRFPGWYCDARPDGSYVSLVRDSHLIRNGGVLDLPGENVLAVRLAKTAPAFAGVGNRSDHAWLWREGIGFREQGPVFGMSSVVWDGDDLLVCRGGPDEHWKTWDRIKPDGSRTSTQLNTGAQGIRAILEGRIITAEATYVDAARRLAGYTDLAANLSIGQGRETACVVLIDDVLRLIEPGEIRFVNASQDGDLVSVAMVRQDTKQSAIVLATLDALRARPLIEPTPVVDLKPLGRPIKVAYFFRDSQQYTDNPSAPGTHSIIVDEPRALPAEDSPAGPVRMIVGLPCLLHEQLAAMWDRVDAVYVAAESDAAKLEQDAALARYIMGHRGLAWRPLISYTGNALYPSALTASDLIGVQGYGVDGETPDALTARLRPWLRSVQHRRVALICQAYDRASAYWTGARLAALQPTWWALAREFTNIEAILLFSDGRKGGTRDYPEMRPIHAEMVRLARAAGPAPPQPVPVPVPTPSPGPTPTRGTIGASYYTSITDPRCPPAEFAARLRDAGCTHTRGWLIDAWAFGPNGPGQYGGFMPWLRDADGVFDLEAIDPQYLTRIHEYVEVMNAAGIRPTLTGWELYSWSHAKANMQWVPDPNRGPFRRNRQGIRYGQGRVGTFDGVTFNNPDDEALIVDIASSRGPHVFLDQLYRAVAETLRGLDWEPEAGNEMPEKGLNYRLRALWRAAGYAGRVQVNRNSDTPGQYANMRIGQEGGFDRIAFHGKKTIGYLGEIFPDEPVHRTFKTFFAAGDYDRGRITLSSDGCRKGTDVADAYEYDELRQVAQDALFRGFDYEHQFALKLRGFTEGRIDLDDIRFDAPFLAALR